MATANNEVRASDLRGQLREFDRLLDGCSNASGFPGAVARLSDMLTLYRNTADWPSLVEALDEHDLMRLLRADPMVRRCQWRQSYVDPYDLVEGFIRRGGDETTALAEAETPGAFINSALLESGLASALRERRDVTRALIAQQIATRFRAKVAGLGVGRADETDTIEHRPYESVASWRCFDSCWTPDPNAAVRPSDTVRWSTCRHGSHPREMIGDDTFDLIYAVDWFDDLGDEVAADHLSNLIERMKPNGALVFSSFAPEMPELALMEAVLRWSPKTRDEAGLRDLIDLNRSRDQLGIETWRGASGRVSFCMVSRLSWSD